MTTDSNVPLILCAPLAIATTVKAPAGERVIHLGVHCIHDVRLSKGSRGSLVAGHESTWEDVKGALLMRDDREFFSDFDSFTSWGTPVGWTDPAHVHTPTTDVDADEAVSVKAAAAVLKRHLANGMRLIDYAIVTDADGTSNQRIYLLS